MNSKAFEKGFYRSRNCDCKALVYISDSGIVRLIKGSTVVFERIDPSEKPGVADKADMLKNEMLIFDSLWTNTTYVMEVTDNYRFLDILTATRLVVGIDDVDPEHYWEPVFG